MEFNKFSCLVTMKLGIIAFLTFSISSCSTIKVNKYTYAPLDIDNQNKIAVVLDQDTWHPEDRRFFEKKLAGCIKDELEEYSPQLIDIVQSKHIEQIVQTVSPDVDYDQIPDIHRFLLLQLENKEFQNKLDTLGIRYLVLADLKEHKSSKQPCRKGRRYFGSKECHYQIIHILGSYYFEWYSETQIDSMIIDTKRKVKVGSVSAQAIVKPALLMGIFLIPIPLKIGFPLVESCNAFGEEIAKFFQDQQSAGPDSHQ